MKTKSLVIFFIFGIMLISSVNAMPPVPVSDCNIRGVIQQVTFREAYTDSCLYSNCSGKVPDEMCCPTDILIYNPDEYSIKILVDYSKTIKNDKNYEVLCENEYQRNSEATFSLRKDKIVEDRVPKEGQIIFITIEDNYYITDYKLKEDLSCKTNADCWGDEPCAQEECKEPGWVCGATSWQGWKYNESSKQCEYFESDGCGWPEWLYHSEEECKKALNEPIIYCEDNSSNNNCVCKSGRRSLLCSPGSDECIDNFRFICDNRNPPQCGDGICEDLEKKSSLKEYCEQDCNKKTCPASTVEEEGKCMKTLSNSRKAEIKIMPETASEKAIEKLGDLGFNVTLKEVGKGDDAKVVYELTGEKQGKFLGIFKIMARVSAQVDAETGDVKVIKPWWAFLASGI